MPPLLVGGRSPAARAGRLADGWLAVWLDPEQVRRHAAEVDGFVVVPAAADPLGQYKRLAAIRELLPAGTAGRAEASPR